MSVALARLRGQAPATPAQAVQSVVAAVRSHLGMGVAFVSEFSEGQRWMRFVDTADADGPVRVGHCDPLEATYCQRVVDGRLPALLVDTASHEEAHGLAVTEALSIGSRISVPIRFSDGSVCGTFCCHDPAPNPALAGRDVAVMEMLAGLLAERLEHDVLAARQSEARRARVQQVLDGQGLRVVLQPIVSLRDGAVVGHEALARFDADRCAPDVWFREAQEVGLGLQLELAAARLALGRLAQRPPGTYLALNLSPEALGADETLATLLAHRLDGVVIELTEHAVVEDYPCLLDAMAGRGRPARASPSTTPVPATPASTTSCSSSPT